MKLNRHRADETVDEVCHPETAALLARTAGVALKQPYDGWVVFRSLHKLLQRQLACRGQNSEDMEDEYNMRMTQDRIIHSSFTFTFT